MAGTMACARSIRRSALDYKRVRLGIGHPGKEFVTHHVLGDFAKADQAWLEPLLDAIGKHVDMLIKGDDNGFMNKLALAVKGADEPEAKAGAQGAEPYPAGAAGQAAGRSAQDRPDGRHAAETQGRMRWRAMWCSSRR